MSVRERVAGLAARLGSTAGRDHLVRALVFIANFGVARVCVYLAPLTIALIAPADVYGGAEFVQSVGLLSAAIVAGAPLAGVSQEYLVRRRPLSTDVIAATVLVGSLAGLIAGLAAWAIGGAPIVPLACFALGLAVQHTVASSVMRALAKRNVIVWTDGFFAIVTFALVVLSWALGVGVTLRNLAVGYLAICVGGVVVGGWMLFRARRPRFRERLSEGVRFGAPIVVSGAFAAWQAGAGRILAGLFVPGLLAPYGIAFRVAGLALGFHQLATAAFYARLYAGRTYVVDRLLALFLGIVVASLFVIVIGGRMFVTDHMFTALDAAGVEVFRRILPIVALQILFWIGNAMLESRLNRFGLAARTIGPSIVINGAAVLGLFAADRLGGVSLTALCWTVAAQSGANFAVGNVLLARRRVPHRRIARVGAVGGAAVALLALL